MTIEIPADLVASIREGRTALLLGAGASRGATDSSGQTIPLAEQLAEMLVAEFLGPEYAGLEFREIYDYSCSVRDVRTVQEFVRERLIGFNPAPFHEMIPTFGWAGILTTNYDLVLERAYAKAGGLAVQRLIPHVKDRDGATDKLDSKSLLYTKLHGCVTRSVETEPPLIASTEQLISFGEGRKGQFDIFLELAKTKNIVFVGYKFNDSNLRQLIDVIVKDGDRRPRHYIVDPGILPAVADYWRERRFIAIKSTFEDFLVSLNSSISVTARKLSSLNAVLTEASTLSKFITKPGRTESEELKQYLRFGIEQITELFEPARDDKRKFYKGFDLGWQPFIENLDIPRKVSDDIISDQIILNIPQNTQRFVILKGHAGSGKTVALRRTCWDSAREYGKICFYITRSSVIKSELFEEIFSLTNLDVFLFVDGVASHRNRILELLAVAKANSSTLIVIGAETFNTWNTTCEELERIVFAEYEMRLLSDKEADDLSTKLEENDSLGNLATIARSKRSGEFMVSFGRQILVALLEATHGIPLVEIIKKEYESIIQADARLLYLDICSLHRFGPPVRAGLISRIHGITFEEFEERLFRPLEQIVQLRTEKSGDFVYEARHPHIASALYDAVLTSQAERFDNLVRLITKLNPSYSYDVEAIGKILRADNIYNTISSPEKGRQIYDIAFDHIGQLPMLLHQRGIYEMRVSIEMNALQTANDFIDEASRKEPWNRSIKHSLAELDLKRSRMSRDNREKTTWRRSAIARASDLTLGDTSPYPYHTIIKAYTDEISDSIKLVEESDTEANVQHLGEIISSAEDALKRGLSNFPGDESLLSSEGELARALSNSTRAESAFRKAFIANPRSTSVAKRLVKILRVKDDIPECISIVSKALESNQGNADLHFELAKLYLDSSPDGYKHDPDLILYHLRRSFVAGDRNYNAQFWYARQLSLTNRFEEAKPIFTKLESAETHYNHRNRLQGHVRKADGQLDVFNGSMTRFRISYGFARCENLGLDLFVPTRELDDKSSKTFIEGSAIKFGIAFNYKGPVAISVRHLTE